MKRIQFNLTEKGTDWWVVPRGVGICSAVGCYSSIMAFVHKTHYCWRTWKKLEVDSYAAFAHTYLEQLSKNLHAPTLAKNGHGSLSGLVSILVRNPAGNSLRAPAIKSSTLCLNSFSWFSRWSRSRRFLSSISLILFCSRSHSSRIRNWKWIIDNN